MFFLRIGHNEDQIRVDAMVSFAELHKQFVVCWPTPYTSVGEFTVIWNM